MLAAIFLSLLAAALKLSSAQFTLSGWEFDPNSIYHVAQMPGLCLMLIAIQRNADATERQPLWKTDSLPAPVFQKGVGSLSGSASRVSGVDSTAVSSRPMKLPPGLAGRRSACWSPWPYPACWRNRLILCSGKGEASHY